MVAESQPETSKEPTQNASQSAKPKRKHGVRTIVEVRKLQQRMLEIAETSDSDIAATSAARAYKDLEMLRRAIRGQPLAIQASMRIEPKHNLKHAKDARVIDVPVTYPAHNPQAMVLHEAPAPANEGLGAPKVEGGSDLEVGGNTDQVKP